MSVKQHVEKITLPLKSQVSFKRSVNAIRIGDEVFTREQIEPTAVRFYKKNASNYSNNSFDRDMALQLFLMVAGPLDAYDRIKEKLTRSSLRTQKDSVKKLLATPEQKILFWIEGGCINAEPRVP